MQTPFASPVDHAIGSGLAAHPAIAATMHFRPESEIYAEGDPAKSFFKVVSGVVRTYRLLSDGRRKIDAFLVEGDIFGLEAGDEYGLTAEAVSDCVVVPYNRRNWEQMATDDSRVAKQFYSYAMQSLERAREHSLMLSCGSASQKVASFLLEMADRVPRDGTVNLAMTRQDIADYLGLTIETVSRTLSQLECNCMIARPSARRIVLKDRKALRHLNS